MFFAPDKFGTGDVIAIATVVLTYWQYTSDKRKMHDANIARLERLAEFQESQMDINKDTDQQLKELAKQTASIDTRTAAIAATMQGIDSRTSRIERQLDQEHS